MDIFISWSGDKSREAAKVLRRWLPDVIQSLSPWMSETDIGAGARWNKEIQEKLAATRFGIICVTAGNLNAPWVLFEAGALAKTLADTYVCPYLIDIGPSDIPEGPLAQFQAKSANEDGTWELLKTINVALKEAALPEDQLQRSYKRCWPELDEGLRRLRSIEDMKRESRSTQEMIEEILTILRELRRIPIKSFLTDPIETDLDLPYYAAVLHDLAKARPLFQTMGRVNRKRKEEQDEDEDV